VAGGWSLSNVTILQSGAPSPSSRRRTRIVFLPAVSAQRPKPLGQRSVAQWFDIAARNRPHLPAMGQGNLRAPGLVNLISQLRTFKLTERVHAEFRGEFFNAFNHTNLAFPA
jgi:hypothetical protein